MTEHCCNQPITTVVKQYEGHMLPNVCLFIAVGICAHCYTVYDTYERTLAEYALLGFQQRLKQRVRDVN